MTTMRDAPLEVPSQLAQLAAHIRAMRTAVATIEHHLHESEAAVFALMKHHGVAQRGEGLTTPEERGS